MKLDFLILLVILCGGWFTTSAFEPRITEPRCSEFNYLESLLEKLVRLENKIDQNEASNNDKIASLQDIVKKQDKQLKRQAETLERPLVAFTAYLDKSVSLSVGDVVKFDLLLLNLGDHYESTTGVFTAPHGGIYFFTWHTQSKQSLTTCLSVNGKCQIHAYATGKPTKDDILPDGNSATLRLTKGDKVWIEIRNGSQLYSNSAKKWYYPAFTGYSLQ